MNLRFSDREAWRAWLSEHHEEAGPVWLLFYKTHSSQRSISYDAAVEEALCFGWIDSIVKRLDDARYLRKFTPRSNTGKWSALNLKRVRRLIESGRMTELGLAKLDRGVQPEIPPARKALAVPRFFQQALARNTRARENFARLAPSYRRNVVGWVSAAKKDETRQRRLREAIGLLERGERLGLK